MLEIGYALSSEEHRPGDLVRFAVGAEQSGVGSGENLNEHVLGDAWPPVGIRLQMLEEAVAIIRELFTGGLVTHDGDYYTVHGARLYTLPEEPPPIMVAA